MALQPWFDFSIDYEPSIIVSPLQLYNDGQGGSSGQKCSQICLSDVLVFDPRFPVDLVNCSIYAAGESLKSCPRAVDQCEGVSLLQANGECNATVVTSVQSYPTKCITSFYQTTHQAADN